MLVISARDITERKHAEEKLKENEAKFKAIFECSNDAIGVSKNGIHLIGNSAYLQMFGFKNNEEIENTSIFECHAPSHREQMVERIRRRTRGETIPTQYETRCIKSDGTEFDAEFNVSTYTLSNELYSIASIRDVTERNKVQEQLKESKTQYVNLFENMFSGIAVFEVIFDEQGNPYDHRMILGNTSFEKDTGLKLRDQVGKTSSSLGFSWPKDVAQTYYKVAMDGTMLYWERFNESLQRYYEIRAYSPCQGQFAMLINDITERKKTEQNLVISEHRLQNLLNSVTDYIYTVSYNNSNEIETHYGEGCISVTGYSVAEFEQNHSLWFDIILDNEKEFVQNKIDEILETKTAIPFEHRIIHKEGNIRWIRNTLVLKVDENGKVDGYDGLIKDITEKKILQHQILNRVIETEENERMHFSQELHDGIGPLLSATKMYVQLFDTPEVINNQGLILSKIKQLIDESSSTVREISFRLSPHILQNYGLIEAIKAYSDKIKESSNIAFELQFSNTCRFDEKAETIIYRVLCECINNTIKYAQATKIRIIFHCDSNYFTIDYSDNGKGFDYDSISKNKKGIGLLNMQSRINSINGILTITSNENSGTAIKLQFDISIVKNNI
jgi:PAS domain S-box-containing protein